MTPSLKRTAADFLCWDHSGQQLHSHAVHSRYKMANNIIAFIHQRGMEVHPVDPRKNNKIGVDKELLGKVRLPETPLFVLFFRHNFVASNSPDFSPSFTFESVFSATTWAIDNKLSTLECLRMDNFYFFNKVTWWLDGEQVPKSLFSVGIGRRVFHMSGINGLDLVSLGLGWTI